MTIENKEGVTLGKMNCEDFKAMYVLFATDADSIEGQPVNGDFWGRVGSALEMDWIYRTKPVKKSLQEQKADIIQRIVNFAMPHETIDGVVNFIKLEHALDLINSLDIEGAE